MKPELNRPYYSEKNLQKSFSNELLMLYSYDSVSGKHFYGNDKTFI
jgi:hypothetical protein